MSASHSAKPGGGDADELVHLYSDMVRRVCGAHLSDGHDIEDAVQETFLELLKAKRERIRNQEAWLVWVAERVCARHHRWRYKHPEVRLADGVHGDERFEDRRFDELLDSLWCRKVLSNLSQRDRDALTLVYVHDLSCEKAAKQLGISATHLRVMAYRARRYMRRKFEIDHDGVGL